LALASARMAWAHAGDDGLGGFLGEDDAVDADGDDLDAVAFEGLAGLAAAFEEGGDAGLEFGQT
jgi:hypothetical protein